MHKMLTWVLAVGLGISVGGQATAAEEAMLELATTSGCFLCHAISPDPDVPVPLGPSYQDIADRYRNDPNAVPFLFDRIKSGTQAGPQNWADKVNMRFMPPSVALSDENNRMLVDWILSLSESESASPKLITLESMLILATTSGCLACHGIDPNPEGEIQLAPSFREVSARYADQPGSTAELVASIRNGTLNNPQDWDNSNMRFMPPSVALSAESANDLVAWILSLEPVAP
jgi:cytochrome c